MFAKVTFNVMGLDLVSYRCGSGAQLTTGVSRDSSDGLKVVIFLQGQPCLHFLIALSIWLGLGVL